jgi:CubicO group peptidase (beta-lactamase class C family)
VATWREALTSGALRVSAGGEVLAEHGVGLADGPGSEPCGPRTRFQIASVSKRFTAAAVLVLARHGRLAVTDPVARWFPGGPEGWDGVTVHHLLSHTSGLGHWDDFPEIDLLAGMPDAELIATVQARPLRYPPGRRFYYSSLGFCLLARIVEQVSGLAYPDFVASALLGPAGLADTFVGSPGQRPHVAAGHADGATVASYDLDQTGRGAGDVYSTVRDLDRWNRHLPGLLGESGYRMMVTPHASVGDSAGVWEPGDAHGYGCFLGTVGPWRLQYHSGHNAGFNSFSGWLPERDLSIAILTNEDSIDPTQLAKSFLAAQPGC